MVNNVTIKLSELYVSIAQAAFILRVNRETVARWIREGKLNADKVGLAVLISKDDIMYIKQLKDAKYKERYGVEMGQKYYQEPTI